LISRLIKVHLLTKKTGKQILIQMNFQQKILVIEDDLELGMTIQNILSFNGYDVCYTNNGASGIQKAFEYNPDLILCDINMDPIDGYQVYKLLEESSILNSIPFIFLTGYSDLGNMRFGMSLGADDYLVKPFRNNDLVKSIEKRLEKFRTIRDEANLEFNRLFNLSPIGLILFDGIRVLKVNQAFRNLIKLNGEDLSDIRIETFIDFISSQKIKNKIQERLPGKCDIYNDEVALKTMKGEHVQMNLVISEIKKFSNYTLYIGLFNSLSTLFVTNDNPYYADEVYNLLKREKIRISEALGEKITNIFKQKTLNINNQNNSFFTKRENEVLCLSMEGLPIKIIADRLSISDRTVEKYRTKLMEKSGSNNMIEVIVYALKNRLVEI
jgi:PAS domain S-box-containing protein